MTGGARGCGLAFAEGLAEAGADVAIFDVIDPVPAFFEIEKNFGVKTKHYKFVSCNCPSTWDRCQLTLLGSMSAAKKALKKALQIS